MRDRNEFDIGIDIGSVSVNIALFASLECKPLLTSLWSSSNPLFSHFETVTLAADRSFLILLSAYKRIKGEPIRATLDLLNQFIYPFHPDNTVKIAVTGSGGRAIADLLNMPYLNEFQVVARAISALHPEVITVLEIGGDSSKYIRLATDPISGLTGIVDYEVNGDCAAGTGSFMDQQASRLLYKIEEVGDIVLQAQRAATIAGRCSVFAKSDMIHAQQKGFQPPEILKGLCEAVVRNFKGAITKSKEITPPVAFIGGVAANKGIVQALKTVFQLSDQQIIIPRYYLWTGAIGCALTAMENDSKTMVGQITKAIGQSIFSEKHYTTSTPLTLDNVVLLRDRVHSCRLPEQGTVDCYLGVDIGSVTTKLVVIDSHGNLLKDIYTKTDGRPIEVVGQGLSEIEQELGNRINILGIGTTGSGRELIGKLIGADTIKDEITAHKTGAMYVSDRFTGKMVDTIFDIGGQDSKYISIENGVVVDFTMNEACAAGTGSFLEEQAEKIGIKIKQEFSRLALRSKHPIRLGERCTVFMEKEIIPHLQQGASKEDITAGLAYSIVYNYLNRVVRGRKIGDTIYFQGGTAYNDAVAAAFATVLKKEIIVPPYNGVIGAIGAALLAKKRIETTHRATSFRGFRLNQIDYHLHNFTCKGCANFCDIQQFTVEGNKTFWGDKCSDRYRQSAHLERRPTIPDLIKFRETLLFQNYDVNSNGRPRVGYPRAMYFYDQFPFWKTYFHELGAQLIISDETNKQIIHDGVESKVAEPCFPVEVAHGHVKNLLEKHVDFVFLPNVINAVTNFPQTNSFLCPWGQTLCYVIAQTPIFRSYRKCILYPNIRFAEGMNQVKKALYEVARTFGFSKTKNDLAVQKAYEAQAKFQNTLLKKGRSILQELIDRNDRAIILLGRPYNIYDRMINLNIVTKLRDYYGINVIPIDFLAADDLDISDITDNMFWNYGRKILQVAKLTQQHPNLHLIYITNFKCGPDSYIKHYVRDASRSPFLSIQFDGHSNDAGIITRCEAYLDSKGFLG